MLKLIAINLRRVSGSWIKKTKKEPIFLNRYLFHAYFETIVWLNSEFQFFSGEDEVWSVEGQRFAIDW